jgi:4-aminobutyrate aminotransferase-like enzyme
MISNKSIYQQNKRLIDLSYIIKFSYKTGKNSIIKDVENNSYVDFSGGYGVMAIGWQNKEIIKEQIRQIKKSNFAPPSMPTQEANDLAEKLISFFPNQKLKCLKATGGANANEVALSVFYNLTNGDVATFKNAYHGWSQATLGMGEIEGFKMPRVKKQYETIKIDFPHTKLNIDEKESLRQLEDMFKNNSNIKIFIAEPIICSGGVFIPEKNYWKNFYEICKKYGVFLIFDEVLTGFGKLGTMFAVEYFDIFPDAITFGKGITSGYSSLGAVLIKQEHLNKYNFTDINASFAWTPYSCAIAKKNIEIIETQNLKQNAEKIGLYLKEELNKIFSKYLKKYNFKVRGLGLMISISPSVKEVYILGRLFFECIKMGLIFNFSGDGKSIVILPPLILDKKTCDKGIKILTKAVKKLDSKEYI